MDVAPIVRYMLLCDDWRVDEDNDHRITIVGLLTSIYALDDPPYPLRYREFCVFLTLASGRGVGEGHIVCISEDTDEPVFATRRRTITFGPDPLEVIGVPFRIRDCTFPRAGRYSVQFWYNGVMLEERPLQLR